MKMTPRYGGDISCMQILKCFDAIAATLKKGGRYKCFKKVRI